MTIPFWKETAGILMVQVGYSITHRENQYGECRNITAVISGKEGIFPLNLDLKAKSCLSKIVMQMAVINRSITAGLHFSTVVFDSWYFASRLVRFLEREKKD